MKPLQELRQIKNLRIERVGVDGGTGMVHFGELFGSVIWSFGGGWEHVSVCPRKRKYVPTWDDMCKLKDMFFRDEETAVQYHPAKSEYVNNLPNCLHLWRPINETLPVPPSIMVGIRDGQSTESAVREMEALQQ